MAHLKKLFVAEAKRQGEADGRLGLAFNPGDFDGRAYNAYRNSYDTALGRHHGQIACEQAIRIPLKDPNAIAFIAAYPEIGSSVTYLKAWITANTLAHLTTHDGPQATNPPADPAQKYTNKYEAIYRIAEPAGQ